MVVPWTGFPLAALLKKAQPLPGAKFVRFVTFHRPEEHSRQRDRFMPWPYNEGLTLAEATNELTFLATGIAGSPGLLASGGLIRGGLPLTRPDLHFVYNIFETAAILVAYLTQLSSPGPRRRIAETAPAG